MDDIRMQIITNAAQECAEAGHGECGFQTGQHLERGIAARAFIRIEAYRTGGRSHVQGHDLESAVSSSW